MKNSEQLKLIWEANTEVIIGGKTSKYSDHYMVETEVEAKKQWELDREKNGLPESATVSFRQIENPLK